ncbi:fimbrial protein [Paraburkholderia bryophila]|uniref:Type 1 fimbria pilin n=1 Tax=Paraburkholderia bryophila TaxID=420952 RepID=A0A7Z0B019_9BURK|nr:fimbrial protein [Paraburkholderia bryophila]NYH15348.1 type 1 fimbria pilin [Paraburkholderia bryophila]
MIRLFNALRCGAYSARLSHFINRKGIWHAIAVASSVLAVCMATPANAACAFYSGSIMTGVIDMGNAAAPTNAATGTIIATKQMAYDSAFSHQTFTCGTNVASTASFQMSGSGTSNTYETNIPGIGIRVSVWSSSAGYYSTPSSATPAPLSWNYTIPETSGVYGTGYLQVRIDLVKTGPIDLSGTNALSYNVGPWFMARTADGASQLTVSNLTVRASVTTRSCSVTQSAVEVTLPSAFVSNLTTLGSTTGSTSFNLQLSCSQGTNVKVTLTDATNDSNRSTTLGLAPGSFASGVGLQVLNGSTPIAYGPDAAIAENTNQWSAGTAAGGVMNIPLVAQYVRTAGALVPGTVKGMATFTMSYQ